MYWCVCGDVYLVIVIYGLFDVFLYNDNGILLLGMDQYGTDSGETSGEGEGDHTMWGLIRDHSSSTIYWRDASNPSFRSLKLSDVLSTVKGAKKPLHLPVNMGAFHTSMIHEMQ